MPAIECPECKSEIAIRKVAKGNSLKKECPNCFSEITVKQIGNRYFAEVEESKKEIEKEWEANDLDQEGSDSDW